MSSPQADSVNNETSDNVIDVSKINTESEAETYFFNSKRVLKLAVRGNHICHSFRSQGKIEHVLNNLSINIPARKIYGLLGPSGCGKTTLLRIICGLVKPESGRVRLFGFEPRSKGSGAPGSAIGYMPQDIALQSDLTVCEMLYYFGRLFFISKRVLEHEIDYLVSLLEIPDKNQLIGKLSGGQQRRVSLACAIIHKPRLAILDEPTVGVDPLLCSRIWSLLFKLSKTDNTTIIITTHYIEECRKADFVGFMRKGQIIKEDMPQNIVDECKTSNLEEAFYQICLNQRHSKSKQPSSSDSFSSSIQIYSNEAYSYTSMPSEEILASFDNYEPYYDARDLHKTYAFFLSISVLVWRYFKQNTREPIFLLILTLFPISALSFLYICIGHTPQNLPVAWIADERPDYFYVHLKPNTTVNDFGQQIKIPYYPDALKSVINPKMIKLIDYTDLDKALKDIQNVKIKAAIYTAANFSESLQSRIDALGPNDIPNSIIKSSTIFIYTDKTDRFISSTIEITLQLSFIELLKRRAIALNLTSDISSKLPIELGTPVYGEYIEGDYFGIRDFAAPGYILVVTYNCALALAALALVKERNDKMFERNYSTGISIAQIILAQLVGRFIFLSLMAFLLLIISIFFFQVPCEGSFIAALTLLLLQTLVGMSNGMLLSIKFKELFNLVFVALCSNFFIFFFSGVFWPLESLPYYFRWMSRPLPFTMPTECLRSILIRKNAPFHPLIWPGFAMSVGWFLGFIILTIYFFKNTFK